MLHNSIKQKHFVVKERADYRMRVQQHEVVAPKGVYSVDFVAEHLDNGKIVSAQIYNFFMTKDEIQILCQGLLSD